MGPGPGLPVLVWEPSGSREPPGTNSEPKRNQSETNPVKPHCFPIGSGLLPTWFLVVPGPMPTQGRLAHKAQPYQMGRHTCRRNARLCAAQPVRLMGSMKIINRCWKGWAAMGRLRTSKRWKGLTPHPFLHALQASGVAQTPTVDDFERTQTTQRTIQKLCRAQPVCPSRPVPRLGGAPQPTHALGPTGEFVL